MKKIKCCKCKKLKANGLFALSDNLTLFGFPDIFYCNACYQKGWEKGTKWAMALYSQ